MEEKAITVSDALELLQSDRLRRENEAAQEIQKALEKYRCVIHTVIEIGDGGKVAQQLKIVAT